MRVYRIEHPFDGLGPYACHSDESLSAAVELSDRLCDSHSSDQTRPSYRSDGLRSYAWPAVHGRFGFPSRHAMRIWFSGWCIELRNAGYWEAVYDVSKRHVVIGKSGRQLVFDATAANLLVRRPLPMREWRVTS